MNNLKRLLEHIIDEYLTEGYYPIDKHNPPPIKEVNNKWVDGDKAYDEEVHGWYSPYDLWMLREYT